MQKTSNWLKFEDCTLCTLGKTTNQKQFGVITNNQKENDNNSQNVYC